MSYRPTDTEQIADALERIAADVERLVQHATGPTRQGMVWRLWCFDHGHYFGETPDVPCKFCEGTDAK